MTTEPDAPHVFAHSVPGDTSLHTGPPEGCTLPACAPAPLGSLAGREQRRRTTANILARIDRAKRIHEDEATLLRTLVTAEQADGDQAREQLAAHTGTRTASDVLVQHDVTRKALCDALDAGYHLNWQQLVDTAQRSHDANAEWQTEAEQHRTALIEAIELPDGVTWDRIIEAAAELRRYATRADNEAHEVGEALAAERDAHEAHRLAIAKALDKRGGPGTVPQTWDLLTEHVADAHQWAMDGALGRTPAVTRAKERAATAEQEARDARQGEAEAVRAREAAEQQAEAARRRSVRYAERLLAHHADARRNRDAWRNARRRAALMAAEVTRRAPLLNQYAERTLDAEAAHDRWKAAAFEQQKRASKAEATIERMKRTNRMVNRGARDADERAERAEATLSDVAKVAFDAEMPYSVRLSKIRNLIDAADQETALGDPQSATEPEQPAVAWAPRPCGEALWGSHGGHRYMLGGKGYQCPGGDVREQPAEPLLRGTRPLVLSIDIDPADIDALLTRAGEIGANLRRAFQAPE